MKTNQGGMQPDMEMPSVADQKKWSIQEIQDVLARKAFDAQSPYLRIDVTDIKDKLAQFRDLEIPRNPLAKRVKVPSVRSSCSLTIWRRAGETVVEQVRQCDIQSKTLPTGERWASITLDRPFEVPIKNLHVPTEMQSSFGEMPTFSMELKLMAENPRDAWPPLDLKRVPPPKQPLIKDDNELLRLPILIAKWQRLPDIPRTAKESLLEMKAWQTAPSDQTKFIEYTPKLGLVVDIDWYVTPSPLQQANEEKRKELSPRPLSISPEPKSEITGYTEWIFEGILDTVPIRRYPAYHCPFCPLRHSGKQKRMRRFGSADEFCLHLRNNHSALRWEYVPKFCMSDDSLQVTYDGTINVRPCNEYDEPARGTKGSDPRELDWQRPKHPLDIEAFLKGDESWLGKKKKANIAAAQPRNAEGPRIKHSDHTRMEIVRRRPPEQIPDIPMRPRRTFAVPRAPPGVHFYRNVTKRVLQEGEYVSESDDDIDEDWLLQKHDDTIDSFTDTTREEKEFIHRFDRHMLCEDLASDLHASEALIRFCRQNRRWLRRKEIRLEFHKKAASLKIQGAVSGKIIWACMEIINTGADLNVKEEDSHCADNNAPPPNYGADPIEKGHLFGHCNLCHTVIRDPRKLIRCSNATCPQPDYHLACIGLASRPPHWRCRRCFKTPAASFESPWARSTPPYPLSVPAPLPQSPVSRVIVSGGVNGNREISNSNQRVSGLGPDNGVTIGDRNLPPPYTIASKPATPNGLESHTTKESEMSDSDDPDQMRMRHRSRETGTDGSGSRRRSQRRRRSPQRSSPSWVSRR